VRNAVYLALALAAAGCNEGNEIATGDFDLGAQSADGAAPDGAAKTDLAAHDMQAKSCGQIVSCVIQCGLTNLTCDPMCIQGADPTAIQQAGALTLCAVQNCLLTGGDGGAGGLGGLGGLGGGGGGTAGIFQCLLDNCGTEVSGCSGLFAIPM
jgi:hypothetical protein